MNIRTLAYSICCTLIPACVFCQQQDADAMFRENATHNFYKQTDTAKTFSQFNWQFQTGAAIRSTPVCNHDLVFIGSSDGYLYALLKSNGSLHGNTIAVQLLPHHLPTQRALYMFQP